MESKRHQRHARWLFTHFNKKYFGGALPKIKVFVVPGRLKCGSWGETEFEGERVVAVRIAEDCWTLDAKDSFLKATILHEQLHVKLGPSKGHSSPEWRAEALRLSRLGAFVEAV